MALNGGLLLPSHDIGKFNSHTDYSIQKGDGVKIPGIILGSYIMPVTSNAYKEDNSEAEKIWYSVQLVEDIKSCIVEHEVTLDQLELRLDANQTVNENEQDGPEEMIHEDSSQQIPTSISIVEEPNHSVDNQQQTISLDDALRSASFEAQAETLDFDVLSVEEVPNETREVPNEGKEDKPCDPNQKPSVIDANKNPKISQEHNKITDLKSPMHTSQRSKSPEKKRQSDMDTNRDQINQSPCQRLSNDIMARIPRKQCGKSISPSPSRQDRPTEREKHDSSSKSKLRSDERSKERREDERRSKSLKRSAEDRPGSSEVSGRFQKSKGLKRSDIEKTYKALYKYSVTIKGFNEQDYIDNVVGSKGMFHKKLLRETGVGLIRVISKSKGGPFVLLADADDKSVKYASEDLVRWIEMRTNSRVRSKIARYNYCPFSEKGSK